MCSKFLREKSASKENNGDRRFGEQLLARQDHHKKSDGIAEARDQRRPRRLRQGAHERRLTQEGKADRKAAGKARPPERDGRPLHLLLALLPDDLVDGPDRQAGVFGDFAFLTLDEFFFGCVQIDIFPGDEKHVGKTRGRAGRLRKTFGRRRSSGSFKRLWLDRLRNGQICVPSNPKDACHDRTRSCRPLPSLYRLPQPAGSANLHRFVADDARHNGRQFGLAGYRAMLERDFEEIRTSSSTSSF